MTESKQPTLTTEGKCALHQTQHMVYQQEGKGKGKEFKENK